MYVVLCVGIYVVSVYRYICGFCVWMYMWFLYIGIYVVSERSPDCERVEGGNHMSWGFQVRQMYVEKDHSLEMPLTF